MRKSLLYILIFVTGKSLLAGEPIYPKGFEPKKSSQSITFTENKGQVSDQNYKPRPDVLFGGNVKGMVFHLRNNGISYQLNRVDTWKLEDTLLNPHHRLMPEEKRKVPDQISIYRVDINWLNCNKNFTLQQDESLPGYTNYYHEVCPNGVHEVKTYKGVSYKNIYNNIDLHYYEKDGNLKYDYIVAPYTDYKQIQLQIQGADKITLQKDGSVLIKTPLGEISEGTPVVFQNGKQLTARWMVKNNVLSFEIENYNPALELIIDPPTRVWGTYYGGSGFDEAYSSCTDATGNVFICGSTYSSGGTIIATSGAYQTTYNGLEDPFIAKFNSNGVRQWATYYGLASHTDQGNSCSPDSFGNVYLAGWTNSTGGTVIATPGSHQPNGTIPGGNEAFLVKFNANGIRLWGTFYGGSGSEYGMGCKVDLSDNVYLSGLTRSTNSISTIGAHQASYSGSFPNLDLFLVKFNSNGVRQWATYYGGDGDEQMDCRNSLSTDASGNVFLSGATTSTAGIATPGSHQSVYGGVGLFYGDAFLVKFNSSGVRQWATYYGGTGAEFGAVCADPSGNIYLAGMTTTSSGTVIATNGSHQTTFGGLDDAYLVKFNANGVRQWGTYYGGLQVDRGYSCTTDITGNVFLTGHTTSTNGTSIATPGSYQSTGIGSDAFLVKFDNTGLRQWGTYYGTGSSGGACVGIDNSGSIFVAGGTVVNSGTTVASPGSHQTAYGGNSDAFLVKFSDCAIPLPTNTTPTLNLTTCSNKTTTLNATVTGTITWFATATGSNALGTGTAFTTPTLSSGTSTFYAEASNTCGINGNRLVITVTINPTPIITASSGSICAGKSFTIAPSGANTYSYSGGSDIVSPVSTINYTVTGTSTAGCTNSVGTVITVTVRPTPTITANSGSICSGKSFTIVPSGANTYTFSGGNNIVSPASTTNYSVTGTSTAGCSNTVGTAITVTVNPSPTISVNSGTICPGSSFTINPSGANTYTYSSGSNIVNPVSTTNYTVTGTSTAGCSNTLGAIFTVTVNPAPTITVSSGAICVGGSFTLTPGGANTYTISGGNNVVVSPSTTTNYSVTGTSSDGCTNTLAAISTVTVNPLPTITIAGNTSVCLGESEVLTAAGANSYTWSPSGNTNSINVSPTSNTNYTVTGMDTNSCVNTATVSLVIKPLPTLSVNSATVCSGTQAILIASVVPNTGITYNWLPGGQSSSSLAVNLSSSTVYSLTVTLDGCKSTSTSTVNVVSSITPNTGFTYNGPYCTTNTNPVPILIPGFSPGGNFSSSTGLNINPNTGLIDLLKSIPGNYVITYSLAVSGCSVATSGFANVIITPPAKLNVSPDVSVVLGSNITLTVSGSSSYSWSPPDYLSCTNCPNPIATPPQSMTYCVSSPEDICFEKTCVTVKVEDVATPCSPNYLTVPNAFTPNNDANNDEFCMQGWGKCVRDFSVLIFDRWGEKVFESTDPNFCWNGIYNGKVLESDVFVYVIKANFNDGTKANRNGNITLIR